MFRNFDIKNSKHKTSGILSLLLFLFILSVTSTHFHAYELNTNNDFYLKTHEHVQGNDACALIHRMQNNPFVLLKERTFLSNFFYKIVYLSSEKSLLENFISFVSTRAPPFSGSL